MKKKLLIVFLICCMMFAVASPAFAVASYIEQPFPGYDFPVSVGSTQLSSGLYLNKTMPQFLVLKDNYPFGIGIQTTYKLDYETDITPPTVYSSFANDIFTLYIEDNDRLIETASYYILYTVYEPSMFIGSAAGSLSASSYQEINGITYLVGTIDISNHLSGQATSLDNFTNGTSASSICVWDNGPTSQLVGELPPQMMNLGITQVQIPTGQQVAGNLRILLPFGIICLALLVGLVLLRKIFRIFQR